VVDAQAVCNARGEVANGDSAVERGSPLVLSGVGLVQSVNRKHHWEIAAVKARNLQ
jgi:hypothetical protein